MKATTSVAQTLTCNIGDVTEAVEVSWKNSAGVDIATDAAGHTFTKGSVESNIQKSTLTIGATQLQALTTTSALTWKCAAKSTVYGDSAISTFQDVVVNFLTYGKFV